MSYAIRNSLILLVVLLLFAGGGWAYIHYYQLGEIDTLQSELEKKKQELEQKQEIANQYQSIAESYEKASTYFNNYEKALYLSSDEDKVFDFLTSINAGTALNDFNFSFSDSTVQDRYGVINMEISGEARYRNLVNFVRGIERSKPLNKVKNLSVTPIEVENEFNLVSYNFNLESYYDRSEILEPPSYDIYSGMYASVHNPFFPLVRDVKPNEDGKINVEKSELVALSTDRVFLLDQNGVMQQVRVGESVYLGKLSSIDLNNRTATFMLDKGGITESVTLEVENENQ